MRGILALALWASLGLGVQAEPAPAKSWDVKSWGMYEYSGWPTPQPVEMWFATDDLERAWSGGQTRRRVRMLTPIEFDDAGVMARWALSDNEVDCDAKGYRTRSTETFTADGKHEVFAGDNELTAPPEFAPISLLVAVACRGPWQNHADMPTVEAAVADSSRRMQLFKAKQKADRDRSY